MNDSLSPDRGGGVSHKSCPAYAKVAVANCRGTGAQADFSFSFISLRENWTPQWSTPVLYRIDLKGIRTSPVHLSPKFLITDCHLQSHIRLFTFPLLIDPSR